jgi:hypothetical protein
MTNGRAIPDVTPAPRWLLKKTTFRHSMLTRALRYREARIPEGSVGSALGNRPIGVVELDRHDFAPRHAREAPPAVVVVVVEGGRHELVSVRHGSLTRVFSTFWTIRRHFWQRLSAVSVEPVVSERGPVSALNGVADGPGKLRAYGHLHEGVGQPLTQYLQTRHSVLLTLTIALLRCAAFDPRLAPDDPGVSGPGDP